ncbi:O-methyltransferase [Pontixanthobacter aquaemixtae]|uniref:Uncharacterized protein n=1 Tax=Pontixanthobacter aquaemixtae TaxID=1958940 RepID=A0A844ZSK6_9SPHN|nr:O-methyltransferase [Pontixanthobacter aquaemixtae]MXO90474.1 hypothetical protein [Pontixanthobacter aquaemixtae]
MTKGNDVPYQLRPNKFIDRQIFLDLLQRTVGEVGSEKFLYISMGGKHLVDHESVYRRVGIRNLFAFDTEEWVVSRQLANCPNERVVCQKLSSSSLPSQIDDLLGLFDYAEKLIIWLDYTRPSERLSQLEELKQILEKCQPGDLVRITMNADPFGFRGDWRKQGYNSHSAFRAQKLKNQIASFFPNSINSITEEEIPVVLAKAIALAASKASASTKLDYHPVLGTTYADRQRMVTVSILVSELNATLSPAIKNWEFTPTSWDDLLDISAPDLSMKEKLHIDQHIEKDEAAILNSIKFQPAETSTEALRAISSYKLLHRYYPTFYAIGIQ